MSKHRTLPSVAVVHDSPAYLGSGDRLRGHPVPGVTCNACSLSANSRMIITARITEGSTYVAQLRRTVTVPQRSKETKYIISLAVLRALRAHSLCGGAMMEFVFAHPGWHGYIDFYCGTGDLGSVSSRRRERSERLRRSRVFFGMGQRLGGRVRGKTQGRICWLPGRRGPSATATPWVYTSREKDEDSLGRDKVREKARMAEDRHLGPSLNSSVAAHPSPLCSSELAQSLLLLASHYRPIQNASTRERRLRLHANTYPLPLPLHDHPRRGESHARPRPPLRPLTYARPRRSDGS